MSITLPGEPFYLPVDGKVYDERKTLIATCPTHEIAQQIARALNRVAGLKEYADEASGHRP